MYHMYACILRSREWVDQCQIKVLYLYRDNNTVKRFDLVKVSLICFVTLFPNNFLTKMFLFIFFTSFPKRS